MSDSSKTTNSGTGNEHPKDDTNDTNATNDAKAQFDSIRQISPYGAEYWSARDLYPLLGYDTWRRFEMAIDRAKIACTNMGEEAADHFAGAVKVIQTGKGAQMEVSDYVLSRFGCYLTAMNGDPRKPEIASAQGYFAVQTRRMEQWDELREALAERVERRQQLTEANKRLNATALVGGDWIVNRLGVFMMAGRVDCTAIARYQS